MISLRRSCTSCRMVATVLNWPFRRGRGRHRGGDLATGRLHASDRAARSGRHALHVMIAGDDPRRPAGLEDFTIPYIRPGGPERAAQVCPDRGGARAAGRAGLIGGLAAQLFRSRRPVAAGRQCCRAVSE